MDVAIIGGGAAGFFGAIAVKENYPDASVTIFEKSQKLLAKVKISGGGRCNVTNACQSITALCDAYPRGKRELKSAFHIFNNHDAVAWFEDKGVQLTIQEDGCIFPFSQNSQSIIDCFLNEVKRLNIKICIGRGVSEIKRTDERLRLIFPDSTLKPERFDKVIVASGGAPKRIGLQWLEALGHRIENPVPSLFTFNMPDEAIRSLMGIVVENASVSIQGTKLRASGPLLITHWGMSGPAILKLSAFGARILEKMRYNVKVRVNWLNESNHDAVFHQLKNYSEDHPKKNLSSAPHSIIPFRLWDYLLAKAGLSADQKWGELGTKAMNQLVNFLTNDVYSVYGKTTFKEEFVTCGGVSLESIDMKTMQSRVCRNLYFAGEVMDIDAITGGYNFQAAWTTAFIAGKLQE